MQPYPNGQTQDRALDGATDGVQLLPRLQDLRLHGLSRLVVNGGEGFFGQGLEQGRGQLSGRKGGVLYSAHLADMGTYGDALLGQQLLGHGAGEHQRGGQAAGEVSAATVVVAALVADEAGVVPVAGASQETGLGVVLGVVVAVVDDGTEGGAGCFSLKDTR